MENQFCFSRQRKYVSWTVLHLASKQTTESGKVFIPEWGVVVEPDENAR